MNESSPKNDRRQLLFLSHFPFPLRKPLHKPKCHHDPLLPAIQMTEKQTPLSTTSPTTIPPPTSTPSKPPTNLSTLITNFQTWSQATSINLTTLHLTPSKNCTGLGLTTTHPIKTGSTLITIPSHLTLQSNNLETRCPRNNIVSDNVWRKLPWWGRLCLLLLDEIYGEGDGVDRGGWLGLLEGVDGVGKVGGLLGWSEEEIGMLDYEVMRSKVEGQRREYEEVWEVVKGERIGEIVGWREFCWGVGVVVSRGFSGELEVGSFKERVRLGGFVGVLGVVLGSLGVVGWDGVVNGWLTALVGLLVYDFVFPRIMKGVQGVALKRTALTPGIDFINHKSGVGKRAVVDYEWFRDRFRVEAGEDYEEGDEVFISYGKHGNDVLLQFYGFVEENNPNDEYVFTEELGFKMGLEKGRVFKAKRGEGFDRGIMEIIQKKFKGEGNSNDENWWTVLGSMCKEELNSKKTTIEDDEMLLKGKCSERERLAIRFRIEKKKVLKELIEIYS